MTPMFPLHRVSESIDFPYQWVHSSLPSGYSGFRQAPSRPPGPSVKRTSSGRYSTDNHLLIADVSFLGITEERSALEEPASLPAGLVSIATKESWC